MRNGVIVDKVKIMAHRGKPRLFFQFVCFHFLYSLLTQLKLPPGKYF